MPVPINFPTSEVFRDTVLAVAKSTEEQAKIERAIGRAFLERLVGHPSDLAAIYATLGGTDPVAKQLFTEMNAKFATLNLTGAKTAATAAANRPGVAASKSSTVRADNPVFKVDHTALHTLAEIGGEEFAKRFHLNR